ncbi:hypothetical protein [Herbaspirillum aquaticum]|uniref:Uncharacterized protein n=1 Tax=Herbaspirillum aquaticum TaxID=568783 RepID=A0A225SVR9_9BURK|nr:hypothetical protein [Herbaspirillum aquaticum]OWY35315.1 hypothetical protein CEJ45_08560 [Herbaspirillum aquaticum]
MAKLMVYQFECYDITSDQFIRSRRWATTAAIAMIPGARPLPGFGVEVEEDLVESDIEGMTEIGFNPTAEQGFQRAMKD